jgi:hypothetical protein
MDDQAVSLCHHLSTVTVRVGVVSKLQLVEAFNLKLRGVGGSKSQVIL